MKIKLLTLILLLSFSYKAQNMAGYTDFLNRGYYAEAEEILKEIKKRTFQEEKDLVIVYFSQWKYDLAYTQIKSMDQQKVIVDLQLKKILIDLECIKSNYSALNSISGISESDLKNKSSWPLKNKAVGKSIVKPVDWLNEKERFTGAAMSIDGKELLMGKKTKQEEFNTSYYRVQSISLSNQELTGEWKSAFVLDENKAIYASSPSVSKDGEIFFSMNSINSIHEKIKKKDKNKNLNNYLGIYIRQDPSSSKNIPFPGTQNFKNCNVTHPFIYEANETILFFTSDREKAGNMDLYYSIKQNGIWQDGKKVAFSSPLNEAYPIARDGVLYFSSRGFQNFGGLDIFQTSFSVIDGELIFSEPKNLMLPINSSRDDMMVLTTGKTTGYLASNRDSDFEDKIYAYTLNNTDLIATTLYNKQNQPIEGELNVFYKDEKGDWIFEQKASASSQDGKFKGVELNELNNYKLVYSSPGLIDTTIYVNPKSDVDARKNLKDLGNLTLKNRTFKGVISDNITQQNLNDVKIKIKETSKDGTISEKEIQANSKGEYEIDFNPESDYDLTFSKVGYEDYKVQILEESDLKDLEMIGLYQESKKGDKIKIPNIYFAYNSSELKVESIPILQNIVKFMNEHPTVVVELSAHTDARGSDKSNMELSKRRAQTSYDFLIKNGVSSSRLSYKGYGETQIINKCVNGSICTDIEHEQNRRVELKIIKE